MTEGIPQKKRGGARPGAGRKPDPEKKYAVEVRLTAEERELLRTLGGSSWLRKTLKEFSSALDKMKKSG